MLSFGSEMITPFIVMTVSPIFRTYMVQLSCGWLPMRLTSSKTIRSVAVRPACAQDSWVWPDVFVAQINTGMKSTVTTASIMRVAKTGERARVFGFEYFFP